MRVIIKAEDKTNISYYLWRKFVDDIILTTGNNIKMQFVNRAMFFNYYSIVY